MLWTFSTIIKRDANPLRRNLDREEGGRGKEKEHSSHESERKLKRVKERQKPAEEK